MLNDEVERVERNRKHAPHLMLMGKLPLLAGLNVGVALGVAASGKVVDDSGTRAGVSGRVMRGCDGAATCSLERRRLRAHGSPRSDATR